jgi:hypothetical protein
MELEKFQITDDDVYKLNIDVPDGIYRMLSEIAKAHDRTIESVAGFLIYIGLVINHLKEDGHEILTQKDEVVKEFCFTFKRE